LRKIAIEEHFFTEGYLNYLCSRKNFPRWEIVEDEKHRKMERIWTDPSLQPVVTDPDKPSRSGSLIDIGEGRLKEMDKVGVDMAVLSLGDPGVDAFDPPDALTWAKKTNNDLARIIKQYPKRFAGLAALAPGEPHGAANELKRAVTELGLKGALINSHIQGEYLDNKKYWIIFETAEELGVPIYIHPRWPSPDMLKPYSTYPGLERAMWGFAAEAGLHSIRLILSGVFDRYPRLKIILGHLGEALPFWLWRIDNKCPSSILKKLGKKPSEYVKANFFVTTSGMFSQPPFLCTHLALGADSIFFAVDYPFESSEVAVQFMDSVPISDSDKEKIYHINAEKLFSL
jgi:5-carboxyvanillate decarboxylase